METNTNTKNQQLNEASGTISPVLFHETALHKRSNTFCKKWDQPTFLYRYLGEANELLYIGITNDFLIRDEAHVKSSPWRVRAYYASIEVFPDRRMAEAAEAIAIENEKPPCNAKWPTAFPPESVPIFAWYLKENGGEFAGKCKTLFEVFWCYPYLSPQVAPDWPKG